MFRKIIILTLATVLFTATFAAAVPMEKYRFLKISSQDRKAVVKTPEGEMKLVAPGDLVGDARISAITDGRVVLEREGEGAGETLVVRLENGRQKVDRMKVEPLFRSQQPVPMDEKN